MSDLYRDDTDDSQQLLHDLTHLPREEAESLYGIEINEDGSIYDKAYDRLFKNAQQWALEC